jgi:DNA-3-methyladenine glycosylase I
VASPRTEVRLRRAGAEDRDQIVDVFQASRRDGLPYLPVLHADAEDRAWMSGLIEGREVWVAEREGRIAGMMVLDGDHLGHLYVAPAEQGRGVGDQLLALAKRRSPNRLELWAFQRNDRARGFYERRGFRVVELTDGSGNEEREPDVRYEWRPRCAWAGLTDPAYVAYHDEEWGVPSHDDRHLFEMLVLEGAQAGLSWATILRKRGGYRRAFEGFDPARVAEFDEPRIEALMQDSGIVRNRAKIQAAVGNARAALAVRDEWGSLDAYLWRFVDGQPITGRWKAVGELPAETDVSRAMSKELKRRGFRFVGPTVCYSFMQAVGMVNDHVASCFRYRELGGR